MCSSARTVGSHAHRVQPLLQEYNSSWLLETLSASGVCVLPAAQACVYMGRGC